MDPIVSIIIPAYNHAHFLPAALRSVQQQTFTNWEILVVDDGSTDNTAGAVDSWIGPRVRYFRQNNKGLSAARNTGIAHAQAEYLAFLDADDEWEPTFLAVCLGFLAIHTDQAGVYTLNYHIDRESARLRQIGGVCVPTDRFQQRNLEGGFFPVHAAVVRAAIVHEVGQFDTNLTSEEDWDLWLRVGKRHQMTCVPIPLASYRVSPNSMSRNAARMHANAMAVLGKYFGSSEPDLATGPDEMRKAYAFAHRNAAYRFIQQQEAALGWGHLKIAASLWPQVLAREDTFYELACGDQPPGYRGSAALLNLENTGGEMLWRMHELFRDSSPQVFALRHVAYGTAHLALGMLHDQAGDWRTARRHILQAAWHHPKLITGPFVRRFVKLCLGATAAQRLKAARSKIKQRSLS